MKIKALNGFKDILPEDILQWHRVENIVRGLMKRFNYSEIRTPILEKTELFARSLGEATDIVEKEMYTFGDKQVTMRPEATASMVRAYIEHGLYVKKPVQRLFTIGPMFRHERPQKGRLRQFHQLSAEVLGLQNFKVDAELMALASVLFEELGINVSLEVNSLGCPKCRPAYRAKLVDFLQTKVGRLCDDCKRRITVNPLRVLDCKKTKCRNQIKDAPSVQQHLCSECFAHFAGVRSLLESLGVKYSLNKFMVRGLDYYCKTTFEFITADLGSQSAVCAGGRYDGLAELLGGPKTPGIGFGLGLERLVLLLEQQENRLFDSSLNLFIVGLGEEAGNYAYVLAHKLRTHGLSVALDHESRSLKSQMKQADKAKAAFVLIIGEQELANQAGLLRDMKTREQQSIALDAEEIEAVLTTLSAA